MDYGEYGFGSLGLEAYCMSVGSSLEMTPSECEEVSEANALAYLEVLRITYQEQANIDLTQCSPPIAYCGALLEGS